MPTFLKANLDTGWLAPPNNRHLVPRHHLLSALAEHRDCAVRLIVGPVGSGKSTLLQQYFGIHHFECAWLSLTPADCSASWFFHRFYGAIKHCHPTIAGPILVHEFDNPKRAPELFYHYFIRNLRSSTKTLTIILDDLHVIKDASWYPQLLYLMQVTRNIKWLVSSTRKPTELIQRFQPHQVFTLNQDRLYFSTYEMRAFLSKNSYHSEFNERIISNTAGWPAGVKLSQLCIHYFSVAVMVLPASNREIFSLLADKLIDYINAKTNDLLTKTAFLERFNEQLIGYVVPDPETPNHLKTVRDTRLFFEISPDHELSFRFNFILRKRLLLRFKTLPEATRSELVESACLWLSERDMHSDYIVTSAHHPHPPFQFECYLKKLVHWMLSGKLRSFNEHRLSSHDNLLKNIPQALIAWCWLLNLTGRTKESERHLMQLSRTRSLDDIVLSPNDHVEINIAAAYGNMLVQQGKLSQEQLDKQIQLLNHESVYSTLALTIRSTLAEAMLAKRDWKSATKHIEQVLDASEKNGFEFHLSIACHQLIRLHCANNDSAKALQICQKALTRNWRYPDGVGRSTLAVMQAYLIYRTKSRQEGIKLCIEQCEAMLPWLTLQSQFMIYQILIRDSFRSENADLTKELLNFTEALISENDSKYHQSLLVLERFRFCILTGNRSLAEHYYQHYELSAAIYESTSQGCRLDDAIRIHYLLCGVFYYQATCAIAQARSLANQLIILNVEQGLPEYHLTLSLLEPWLEYADGRLSSAYSKLNLVLLCADQNGALLGALDDIPGVEAIVKEALKAGHIEDQSLKSTLCQLGIIP